jgi:ATP-dependent Clp protease ATP-binding subunit ClpC
MSIKIPVITWQDARGRTSAKAMFTFEACAFDEDEPKALEQLKRYMNWYVKREMEVDLPKIVDVKMDVVSVPIRPVREVNNRTIVSSDVFNFRTVAVYGVRANGYYVCELPFFDIEFDCAKKEMIHGLAKESVQTAMRKASSNEICNRLMPASIHLTEVYVKEPANQGEYEYEPLFPPALAEVAIPLGRRQSKSQFSRAWQRDATVKQLVELIREENTNIMLVGAGGIGKTTIMVEAIRTLEREKLKLPEWFGFNDASLPRFWLTSAPRLIAGMQYLGQWEERCETVIEELSEIPGVLCVERAVDLMRYGGTDANSSIARFLIPFLANRELRIITEANEAELQTMRRLLPGFDSLFQLVAIEPFRADEAVSVLKRIGQQFARNKKIEFDLSTVDLTYRLFKRFMPYESFPGKCVSFWRSILAATAETGLHHQGQSKNENPKLTPGDVIEQFVELTGLPEDLIRDEVPMSYRDLVDRFRQNVIGQDHACEKITSVITNFKAGLNDPHRPLGVMLFCGPTGVGKTELAKQLSNHLFGSGKAKDRLIRLDMSEYAVPGSAERLLVQDDGRPSSLVKRIREQPFCVLLLDEIEKASHEVFDALMTVFDEGRLTDRLGRETIFQSVVIIMTSNLGVRTSAPIGFESGSADNYIKAVREFFRPEFYNRFDFVIPFNSLDQESVLKIVIKELKALSKREGLEKRKIKITWDEDVPFFIATLGYDRRYGARPLQRAIEQYVVKPIAHKLAQSPRASADPSAHPSARPAPGTTATRIHLRIEQGEIRI